MFNKKDSQKLVNKIKEYKNIIIAKHESPDWDAQGSAIGMKDIIVNNFQNKNVFIVGHIVGDETKIFEDEKLLNDEIIKSSLLITVDTANLERLDFQNKNEVKEIFKVDHHIKVDNYGNEELVDESAIACTQIIALWAKENSFTLTKQGAEGLYYGLITDSNRFMYDKTNNETFEAAMFLISFGIEIKKIYDSLYLKNLKSVKWLNKAFQKAEFVMGYPIAFIKIENADHENLNLHEEEVKSALYTMSNIKEIAIWFIAYESILSDKIKVSIRSRDYDVNKVAKMYNGGGHKLASGAKLNNFKEVDNLIEDLKKLLDNKL
ncbi:DHH family phosphoesterase [Spiroplasma tabanidicola]|uniref:DHH family phosphoesterase n=1 Tax=Spiroplasma tabanidicola TaxID=324079 RepID=UPI0012DC0BB1|nr:bifunctional oligoribonuclease/PAP phosphatase NrnA [Spiroplasma tabanidicola]